NLKWPRPAHTPQHSAAQGSFADRSEASVEQRDRSRGQMLVIFVFSIFVLVGFTSIVVDIAWYWANELKVQRASDAAALAGVVYLPGDGATAISTADAIAAENGYTTGTGGVTVTPAQDGTNDRQLDVTISAPVQTFF